MQTQWHEWFAKTTLSADDDLISCRQKGIEKFAKSVDKSRGAATSIAGLCRLAFDLPEPAKTNRQALLNRMQTAFVGADPKFAVRGNDLVMQILAGAVLEYLLICEQISTESRDRVVLAVKCAPVNGEKVGRVGAMFSDLLGNANFYAATEAGKRRQLIPATELAVAPAQRGVSETLKKISFEGAGGASSTAEHLNITRVLVTQMGILAKEAGHLSEVQTKAVGNQKILEEEVNLLWWIFGRRSHDLDTPFEQIALASACLIAAKELADMTTTDLGHPSATEFLATALAEAPDQEKGDQIKLLDAVKQTPYDWRLEWYEAEGQVIVPTALGSLCPVALAVELSAQSDGDDWQGQWQKATGLPANYALTPNCLSQQLYDECLLMRACRPA